MLPIKAELEKMMEIEYKSTKNGNETLVDGKVTSYNRNEETFNISFNTSEKGDNNNKEIKCKFNMEQDEMSIGLTIDSNINYTDDVQIESLNVSNANILNNMSTQEMQKLFENISKNLENKLQEKAKLLGLNDLSSINM